MFAHAFKAGLLALGLLFSPVSYGQEICESDQDCEEGEACVADGVCVRMKLIEDGDLLGSGKKKRETQTSHIERSDDFSLRVPVTGGILAVGVAGLALGTYGYFKEQALWDSYDFQCQYEMELNPEEPCGFTRSAVEIPSDDAFRFRDDHIEPAHRKMVIGLVVGGGALVGAGASWIFLSMEDGGTHVVGFSGRW